jgi:GNAT superfamily N-acetyltransferase
VSSSPSINIRLADSADAPAIASLLAAAFAEYLDLYTPAGYAATAISPEDIARRIEEGPVWVSIRDGLIVGTVSVVLKGESLYVRGMAVLPLARGQRIGELLLAHVEKFAASKGIRRLFLSTTPFLDRAIRLYEHFGFRRTSEGPHELFGTPLFTMEKLIGRSHTD